MQRCVMGRVSRTFRIALAAAALASAAGIAPAVAQSFTIAVIPDPQNMNDAAATQPRGSEMFHREMQYVAASKADKNLVFVTFVGDIVQHGDGRFRTETGGTPGAHKTWNTPFEWRSADRAISALGKQRIPFGMSPGNHDYDNASWWPEDGGPGAARPLAGHKSWLRWFGARSKHFAGKTWYGGSPDGGFNSYQMFRAGGVDFLHFSFEMEPGAAVLDWAQSIIDTHPDSPVIFSTHEWLVPANKNTPDRSNDNGIYFAGEEHLSPDQIWDRFVRKNKTVFLILSGHTFTKAEDGVSQGENLRIDTNDAGLPVYQVLQDYQGYTRDPAQPDDTTNGGAGWVRFIEFDIAKRQMHFYTYSPVLGRYAGSDGDRTFGADPKYSNFILPLPPQVAQ